MLTETRRLDILAVLGIGLVATFGVVAALRSQAPPSGGG
jgi:hypothetical protein